MLKTPLGYSISIEERIEPGDSPVVVIASATGVVKEFYKHFASYLVEKGMGVVTFDYGGIGKSKPISLRRFRTSAQRWATNDLESVIRHVRHKYPGRALVLLGHSIGGQLIGLAPSARLADQVVLVGAQSGYYKFWPVPERWKMLFAWKVLFPLFYKWIGYVPTKRITAIEDLPGGMAMEWARWCLSPNYLFDYIDRDKLFFNAIKAPLFSLSTDGDKFATEASTDWLTTQYSAAKVKRIHLKPEEYGVKNIGHFGYFQKRCSQKVWPLLHSCLQVRTLL